jgi:integrase/recombinase XerC
MSPDRARTDSTELATTRPADAPPALVAGLDLVAVFFEGMNARTRAAYGRDLDDFARWLHARDRTAAVDELLRAGHGNANAMALGWRGHMVGRGLSSATIARKLAALKSIVKLARTVGRVAWSLEAKPPKVERHRDTRGPGPDGWALMSAALVALGDGPRARRDRAIVRLLHDRGLRRGEVCGLDLAHFDAERRTVAVLGKGRAERERLRIGPGTCAAVAAWVESRGREPGPLFVRLDGARPTTRLAGESIRRIVAAIAESAGLPDGCRPHGLRHEAITAALDSGRDVRDVQQFSRHKDVRTLMIYDDRRKDVGGDIADQLGG